MTPRSFPIRNALLVVLTLGLLAVAGLYVASAPLSPAPASLLAGLDRLLAERRFDKAEAQIRKALEDAPDDPQANMLMAQVALARDDQKPELALKHLRRIRAASPSALAIVRLNQGKAYSALGDYAQAEQAWIEALRQDPQAPEAGWALLGLYYVQGRREEAGRLGMQLYAVEPDPHDRVQLLLELLRQDAKSLVIETIVPVLQPVVEAHPGDVRSSIALARALIQTSRHEEGLALLRRLLEASPDSPLAWESYLEGLDEAYRYDELSQAMNRLPHRLANDSRFLKFRGSVAQSRHDWSSAAHYYRGALEREPFSSTLLYRLSQTLRAAGQGKKAEELEQRRRTLEDARGRALGLYEKANATPDLGTAPHTELCHRLAELREQMGHPEEAIGWHETVLRLEPTNSVSRSALDRLAPRPR